MSSLGAWRQIGGAIMIANQPPFHIPSGARAGPSSLHWPPRRPHPLPPSWASTSPHSPSPWPLCGPAQLLILSSGQRLGGPRLTLGCVTGQKPLFLGTTQRSNLHVLALSTDAGMAVATVASAPTAVEDDGKLRGCERNRERRGRERL